MLFDPDIFSGSGEDLDGETPQVPTPVKTPPKSPMRQTSTSRARRRTTSTSSAPHGPVVRSGARTIYTAGRPPWYDSHGQLKEAFVIGKSKTFLMRMPPISSSTRIKGNQPSARNDCI